MSRLITHATSLDSFADAFRTSGGGCRRECKCGRQFYNPGHRGEWTWEAGELEALYADKNATMLDYTVQTLSINGVEYVIDCDCWHVHAKGIIAWLNHNDDAIAQYLTNEKRRKFDEAERAPVVREVGTR